MESIESEPLLTAHSTRRCRSAKKPVFEYKIFDYWWCTHFTHSPWFEEEKIKLFPVGKNVCFFTFFFCAFRFYVSALFRTNIHFISLQKISTSTFRLAFSMFFVSQSRSISINGQHLCTLPLSLSFPVFRPIHSIIQIGRVKWFPIDESETKWKRKY